MIWLAALVLAALAMAPLLLVVLRRRTAPVDRREAALALHRAQLTELDRDLSEERIGPAEHATAVLEVQRRLLRAAGSGAADGSAGSRTVLAAVAVLVPGLALGLYLLDGHPELPDAPMSARVAESPTADADTAQLLAMLRGRLAVLDPGNPQYRQGYVLLGSMEASRGDFGAAAAAWKVALKAGFDATLAARTAETLSAASGHVTPEAADLFRRALADAPLDAPWRKLAEARLAQAP